MPADALSWDALTDLAAATNTQLISERLNGPTNAQAQLRLFGQSPEAVRVTLYRDHHAWCPYCQKVWLWLEERRIPYRIRKVTMVCYGEKEAWYRQLVPSGMLPALELDGRLLAESDRILAALEASFGPLGAALDDPRVLPLRRLERLLFGAWCQWLCYPHRGGWDRGSGDRGGSEGRAREQFRQLAQTMEQALGAQGGPFLLGREFTSADAVFVPYVERMNASLAYYKGYLLRREHPAIHRWFVALEQRATYLGTQGDFHTHAHDLPPQMGGCYANGEAAQQALAARIDRGPWPIGDRPAGVGAMADQSGGDWQEPLDPETSQIEPAGAGLVALARVIQHRAAIALRNPLDAELFEPALRAALTNLATGSTVAPPGGSAAGLRYLRDRISVPRDMPLHAARRLRQALEATARLDPRDPGAQPPPIPVQHRRDQDPRPFLQVASAGVA